MSADIRRHKVPVQHDLTDEQVTGLVITAVEHMGGGCLSYQPHERWERKHPTDHTHSEKIARDLLEGYTVHVTDRWDYDQHGTLTLDGLLKGIGMRAAQRGMSPEALCEFIQSDVIDADCAVQYALWDKIVLG